MVIKILVLFGTMFLLMMIGSPIAVALGVATMGYHDGHYKYQSDNHVDGLSEWAGFLSSDGNPVFYAGRKSDEIRRHIPKDPGFC